MVNKQGLYRNVGGELLVVSSYRWDWISGPMTGRGSVWTTNGFNTWPGESIGYKFLGSFSYYAKLVKRT